MLTLRFNELQEVEGRLILVVDDFNFERFALQGEQLIQALSASLIEYQLDGDMHSWLVDFEGTSLLLRAEFYSEAVWFEALQPNDSQSVIRFLASLFTPELCLR